MSRADQDAGDIVVISSKQQAHGLIDLLYASEYPVGIDTETVGCDPTSQSPVGTAKIACWSLAYVDHELGTHSMAGVPLARRVFIPHWGATKFLDVFTPWLEDHTQHKVGHNVFTYDRHVFANHGITLQGVYADTLRMSKLGAATSLVRHGLKDLMKLRLGYELGSFKELFSVPKRMPSKQVYVRDGHRTQRNHDNPLFSDPYTLSWGAGEYDTVSYKTREMIPLDEIPTRFPSWIPKLVDYASLDAKATLELYFLLRKQLEDRTTKPGVTLWNVYREFWNSNLYVLNAAERNGWRLDSARCGTGLTKVMQVVSEEHEKAVTWAGQHKINLRSPKQLQQLLYGKGPEIIADIVIPGKNYKVPRYRGNLKAIRKTKAGERPTDEGALTMISRSKYVTAEDVDGLQALLNYKKATKYAQYLEKLPGYVDETGRLHCVVAPETDTGRLSARNPALQQIPARDPYGIREAFVAEPGHKLVVADYSQLEMYVLAHILIALFDDHSLYADLQSSDGHSATAKRCWPGILKDVPLDAIKGHPEYGKYRDYAKTVNYAVNYGKSAAGLGAQIRDANGDAIGRDAAEAILESYHAAYPNIAKYHSWVKAHASKHGGVYTLLGRWRPLPDAQSPVEWQRARAYRQALNTPIQGSAADIVTMAMLKANTYDLVELREQGYYDEYLAATGAKLIMQIHDELVYEVPEEHAETACKRLKYLMENPVDMHVDLRVDAAVNSNWGEGH